MNSFTEQDLEQATKFANLVFAKAQWNGLETKETFEIRDSLAWVQTQLLPKIRDNILEVKAVHDPKPDPKPKPKTKSKAKGKRK